jgi:prefoldin subunit 2
MASPQAQVIEQFNGLRREADELWRRLNEVEAERQEHSLVLETLRPLDAERRCFRLVGGVLVQRSVAEAMPAVARNMESLEEVRPRLPQRSTLSRAWCRTAASAL